MQAKHSLLYVGLVSPGSGPNDLKSKPHWDGAEMTICFRSFSLLTSVPKASDGLSPQTGGGGSLSWDQLEGILANEMYYRNITCFPQAPSTF